MIGHSVHARTMITSVLRMRMNACDCPEHPCLHHDHVRVTNACDWPQHSRPHDDFVLRVPSAVFQSINACAMSTSRPFTNACDCPEGLKTKMYQGKSQIAVGKTEEWRRGMRTPLCSASRLLSLAAVAWLVGLVGYDPSHYCDVKHAVLEATTPGR